MIGILAFGSLINDPGPEIQAATVDRKEVKTPFNVEFARYSGKTRGGAPTLVPVESGGLNVNAVVFILKDTVSMKEAANMLWRREIGRVGTKESYNAPSKPTPNSVLVKSISNFEGMDNVLYTDFPDDGKISEPTSKDLSAKAIESAKAISNGKDGISYLMNAKTSGIITPLMSDYENKILQSTKSDTLEKALEIVRTKKGKQTI